MMADQTAPLSSQEYIAQLRAQRQQRREPAVVAEVTPAEPPVTAPTTPIPPQPLPETSPTLDPANPALTKPIPEEDVFEWTAPSRPFKKRDRRYYTTVAAIVVLVSLILFFAGQFLPIAVVVSVGFLAYVLSSVPPHEVAIKLTTFGIRMENQLYYWEELGRFWFDEKFHQPLVHIETARFPGRMTLVLGPVPAADMRELLSEVLLEQKPEPTFIDKAGAWLEEKIPLEVES